MTSRERVSTTLRHQEPDRVPVDFGSRSSAIEEQAYGQLQAHLGIGGKTETFLRSHAVMTEEMLRFLHVDTRWIRSIPPASWMRDNRGDVYVDRWNVPWLRRHGSLYYELEPSRLVTMQHGDIEKLEFPELVSDEMLLDMRVQAENHGHQGDYSLWCDVVGAGIFERACYLRGFEQLIVEMMVEKKFAHHLFEKILHTEIVAYRRILEAIGPLIEGVLITEDVATQDSLMMSPETYREMLEPYQRQLIESIQSRGVSVLWHSCGAVHPLIPDFINMGIRILHPIQTSARGMCPRWLKEQFGRDLVFWGGGCDTQTVLQRATAPEVEAEVRQRIAELGPGGGFVFTTTHCIQPGTPVQNILAMVAAYKRFGAYPLLSSWPEGNSTVAR
ncbi:hypothetical protein JXA88_15935 [Candidatus Fermentibacteria bacterium]|nr:hypothetical protein [Candidatus Fermentibacteria bacterium]